MTNPLPQEIRNQAMERLRAGEFAPTIAAELRIGRRTLYQCRERLREPNHPPVSGPRKIGRPPGSPRAHEGPRVAAPISGADLTNPDARIEAKACLRIALADGGIAKMRETIRITGEQERALRRMTDIGQLSLSVVFQAIECSPWSCRSSTSGSP